MPGLSGVAASVDGDAEQCAKWGACNSFYNLLKGFLWAVDGRRITELNNQLFEIEDAKYFMAVLAMSFSYEL